MLITFLGIAAYIAPLLCRRCRRSLRYQVCRRCRRLRQCRRSRLCVCLLCRRWLSMSVCKCVCRVLDVRCSFSSYVSTCVFFEAHVKGPKKDQTEKRRPPSPEAATAVSLLFYTVQISRLLYYPFSISLASIPINGLFVTPSQASS